MPKTRPNRVPALVLTASIVACTALGNASSTGAAPAPASTWRTPNTCIALNGGDYNACNVDNSGRGDLPYRLALRDTPDGCITLNGGDYDACNVGNSGRGDLPYRPVH